LHVIGTAGHVDHGKSTLVKALTGIDPDRLAEEKAREMTIDLGFAWLTLGDEEVGVVDVPGHRDFIENMLAGIGGIDLALLIVAADEGIMPQTREHLAILDLLGIADGIIALTKMDLIDDSDWLELVMLDVTEALAGTVLEDAPIVPLSAFTGEGIEELKSLLHQKLESTNSRPDFGKPRLPIDRIFTLSGFGNIVTGTLVDGRFRLGDQVEIQPGKKKARIRGLQTHRQKLDLALPGSRVAINLTGIDREEIRRGDVVAAPDTVEDTILIDATYRQLADAGVPLKHNAQVKLFVGAAEVVARTRILGSSQIEPAQEGWLQLALEKPIALAQGDRFILRRPSPATTLGGGRILDPHPGRRHRRFRPEVVERMQTLTHGTPDELLAQTLGRIEPTTKSNLLQQSSLDRETAETAIQELEENQQIVWIGKWILSRAGWQQLMDKQVLVLRSYHRDFPLRLGIPREELRSRLRLAPPVFNPLIEESSGLGILLEEGPFVRLPDHKIIFSASQQANIDRLLRRHAAAGVNSPSVKECKKDVGDDVYHALIDLGELRQLNSEVVYAISEYKSVCEEINQFLSANQRINAAQARDLLGTSRKYAIAILEHLDDIRVTRRVGDYRELV
jgi:selenocysteine-specific elongation factor